MISAWRSSSSVGSHVLSLISLVLFRAVSHDRGLALSQMTLERTSGTRISGTSSSQPRPSASSETKFYFGMPCGVGTTQGRTTLLADVTTARPPRILQEGPCHPGRAPLPARGQRGHRRRNSQGWRAHGRGSQGRQAAAHCAGWRGQVPPLCDGCGCDQLAALWLCGVWGALPAFLGSAQRLHATGSGARGTLCRNAARQGVQPVRWDHVPHGAGEGIRALDRNLGKSAASTVGLSVACTKFEPAKRGRGAPINCVL